ncbi:MAG: hypothetical protein ACLQIB_39845 [Isosphaeraceae bacterium]
MTSSPGSDLRAGKPTAALGLDEADLALILAFRAWDGLGARIQSALSREVAPDDDGTDRWHQLDASWAGRLRTARDGDHAAVLSLAPEAAIQRLRRMHQAAIRVDLNRVHPTWCVRALKEESPTVQRLVAAHAPLHLRTAIRIGLSLAADDLAGERPVDPDVLGWALALWTERLVGGDPARTDDPAAIAVLCRLSPRSGYAICRLAGQIKCGIGGQPPVEGRPSAAQRACATWLLEYSSAADPRFLDQVSRDIQSKALARVPGRYLAARLGVATLARLLADCEPFRLRWALQHWPYPIAKLIRSLMPAPAQRPAWLSHGERLILKTAWDRLNLEGRLALPWPDS